MNKHFLKILRDNMPETLKSISGRIIRNELIRNQEFIRYMKLLEERDGLDQAKIEENQLSQLKEILKYAYYNVPYYQELFNTIHFDPEKLTEFRQIEIIPFLTREIITDNFDKLISKKKVKHGYYVGTTGGSSGLPLKFLLDFDSVYREAAFIYYYRRKLGYNLDDRLITFRQVKFGDKLWTSNPMYNEIHFFPMKLSKATIGDYAKKINEYKPDYLNGYLSSIWYFAKLLEEYGMSLDFKLKGIFLISENLDTNQRNFIEHFFKVKSSTFYGHSERCVIAEETIPGRYRFDPYYGYTEQIRIDDNNYSIVGTGFLNRTMPLIRYKTDDTCSRDDQYYSIGGKRSSVIGLYGINNEFLPSTAFDLEDPVFRNIMQYQLIQNEKGKADLLIIVNKIFNETDLVNIRKQINYQTKGIIKIEVKIVNNLILTPRGKYQMYISNLG
jgi:phenylacetate-CoA ligase